MKAQLADLKVGQKFRLVLPAGKSAVRVATEVISTKFGFTVKFKVLGSLREDSIKGYHGNTEIEVIP